MQIPYLQVLLESWAARSCTVWPPHWRLPTPEEWQVVYRVSEDSPWDRPLRVWEALPRLVWLWPLFCSWAISMRRFVSFDNVFVVSKTWKYYSIIVVMCDLSQLSLEFLPWPTNYMRIWNGRLQCAVCYWQWFVINEKSKSCTFLIFSFIVAKKYG